MYSKLEDSITHSVNTFPLNHRQSNMDSEACRKHLINYVMKRVEDDCPNYKAGYDLLIGYFDHIPEEDKPSIDQQLKELYL